MIKYHTSFAILFPFNTHITCCTWESFYTKTGVPGQYFIANQYNTYGQLFQ